LSRDFLPFAHVICVRNARDRPIKIKNPKAPAATRATNETF
jgi:hypothetical protein